MTEPLFQSSPLGPLTLPNRIVMAPMTRSRSLQPGNVPSEMNARYYAQRASAGLIVSEGTQVSPQGQGYAFTPGIHAAEQIEGWKLVTKAVHDAGGRIFAQLWHVGRVGHPGVNGLQPVAPSALTAETQVFVADAAGPRLEPVPEPRALDVAEIPGIVADFAQAARNARAAGFDGVEIHAANGYLIDQFMRSGANTRTDAYGGSLDNRLRFLGDVTQAVADAIGADRTGVRLSPFLNVNGIWDDTPEETFLGAAAVVGEVGAVYLHLNEEAGSGLRGDATDSFRRGLRERFHGAIILCGGYTLEKARQALDLGIADLVAFGRPYISNPDLVERLRTGVPLADADRTTFYGGDENGYLDYPTAA